MVSEVIYTSNPRFDKDKIKKQKKSLIPKFWGLGLGIFALLVSLGGISVAIWHIIDGNSKLTETNSEVTPIVFESNLNDYAKSYVNPDNENTALQQDIENLGNISVTKSSLTSSGVTFNDYFLAQSKMLGKGITNVNEKVEALWNNFIDKHFMKARVLGTSVTHDTFAVASASNSALSSLNDTTGPLGISSNFFVGSTADPKILRVTGDTLLDSDLEIEGDIKAKSSVNVIGVSNLLGDVTVGSTTTAADLVVTGESNLLSKVNIGTTTTPANLEVSGESLVRGTSALLGDVTVGNAAGTTANLLVSGTTEFRGTTSLLADVTVGSNGNAANLEVIGETTLVDHTRIINTAPSSGALTQKTLDVGYNGADDTVTTDDSTTTMRGNLDLSATNVIGLKASGISTLTDLVVTGIAQIQGTTSFSSDVTIGEVNGRAADLTVTGTTNLNSDLVVGSLGANGILGGNDDSTTVINGTLNLTNADVVGLSILSSALSSNEISGGSSSFNISSLRIQNGDRINLFVRLRISQSVTNEYLQIKQVTYTNSTRTYKFEFPFIFPVYTTNSNNYNLNPIAIIERRIIVNVVITNSGNISIGTPSFQKHQIYFEPNQQNVDFSIKKGHADKNDGSVGDWVSVAEERKAWNLHFGSEGRNPTYSSSLVISKANNSN